jgi:hypothetical protein
MGWLFGPARGIAPSPWGPVGAVIVVLVVSVLAAALAGTVMAGLIAAVPWLRHAVETRCGGGSGAGGCVGALLAGLCLVYFFVVLGLLVACWFRRGATPANSLLLRPAQWGLLQYAAFAILTVVTLVVLQQVLFYLTEQLGGAPADPMRDLEKLREAFGFDEPVTIVLMALLAVVFAPLAEEFMFRGMLYAAFQKTRLGVIGSAILLSALWAVMHWGYSSQNLVALFGLGLLFAYIVWRTGSLWPAVVGHAANNLVAVVALMSYQP